MKPFTLFALTVILSWPGFLQTGLGQTKPRPLPIRRPQLLTKPVSPGKTVPSKIIPGKTITGVPTGSPSKKTPAASQRTGRSSNPKLSQAMALQFNRSPSSILKTWSSVNNRSVKKARPEPPGPDYDDLKKRQAEKTTSAVKQFEEDVILGNWKNAKLFLASFKRPEDAQKVYNHLLSKLQLIPATVVSTTTVPSNLPAGVVIASPAGVKPDDHVLSPRDILGIIQLPPGELTSQQIMAIGSLVSKSIQQGFELKDLIKQFDTGLSTIGGQQASHRLNAARVLLGARRPLEAKAFLKPTAQAIDDGDIDSIALMAEIVQLQYNLQRTPELLEEAWRSTQTVLATPGAKDEALQKALKYAVELAPKVSAEIGQAWLKESFSSDTKRGIEILSGIGQATADGQKLNRQNPEQRREGLSLQKTAVQTLLQTAPGKAKAWSKTLDMLALNWLKEAKFSQTYAKSTGRPAFRRDRYGNIYYATNDELMRRVGSSARPRPVPVEDILQTRPEGKWFDVIDPGLKSEFEETLARLYLKNSQEAKAFPYIEVIATKNKLRAKKLVDEFLQVWTRNHNPNENRGNRNQYIYFFGFEQRANSIPLTRSKQQRNLKELRGWISRLRKLELDEIDEQALVRAFTTCHSTAEVYRVEDIEEVFGSIQGLKDNTVAGLAQKMRTNLSSAWRQPRVQESKKTNRKEPQIRQEVLRGYEVAAKITREALFKYPESWQLQLARACIRFDQNAYQQEIKKSSEFTEKQRKVFDEFAGAAKTYAQQVSTMKEEDQTTEVYDIWFYAALGACDLSLLTHEKLSIESQFDQIRAAIDALPGEAPAKHLSQFANKLFTRMSPLKPEMKYRYLKGGFTIVGDHPDATDAQKVFQYYKDLVNEIELQTRIDGSDRVGEKPFGLFVNLRHTEEVERESGGFSKYLQNQNNMTYAYNYGRPTNDYRDAFETATIAALSEHFEVISVTFEDEKNMESREAPQPGWRITPYAYILLKSRGQEVDIIPPLKLDLDFLDTSGYAVLPIESKAIPVDTNNPTSEKRPIQDLKITQTLDERRAGEGKLVLEVKATARGLIPGFNHLLKLENDGFEVVEQQDQGVSVSAFDPESNEIRVITEREWLVELKATENAGMPKTFEFCAANNPETQMVFKRYHDADLVDVEQVVPLENSYGQTRKGWILWLGLGSVATILALFTGFAVYRRPRAQPVPRYTRPQVITPLSVISLLQEIRSNETLADDQITQLDQAIQRIEQHFFDTQNVQAPDLDEETDYWLALAN